MAACEAEDVRLDEIEIQNLFTSNGPTQYTNRKLEAQRITLHYTLIGPVYERP